MQNSPKWSSASGRSIVMDICSMDLSESQVPDKTKIPKTCQISVMSDFDLKISSISLLCESKSFKKNGPQEKASFVPWHKTKRPGALCHSRLWWGLGWRRIFRWKWGKLFWAWTYAFIISRSEDLYCRYLANRILNYTYIHYFNQHYFILHLLYNLGSNASQ